MSKVVVSPSSVDGYIKSLEGLKSTLSSIQSEINGISLPFSTSNPADASNYMTNAKAEIDNCKTKLQTGADYAKTCDSETSIEAESIATWVA